MKADTAPRGSVILAVFLGVGAFFTLISLSFLVFGWVQYKYLERSVVEKMDQYYLNITRPDREEYLLEGDQVFEVPYMASRLSVGAVPTRIYDREGRLLGEYVSERGLYVRSPEELPASLKNALVATEDGTFYRHHGVNWRAMARAMGVNLRTLRIRQGGSTLTQQLAKLMFTTRRRTYVRKIFELFCARKLEEKFTKDQILFMYLNFAYFGHGCFGIESASRYYFGKATRGLELAEAALLIGLISSPSNYSPFDNPELARARQRTVLTRMARLGFVPRGSVQRISEEFWTRMAQRPRAPEASFWRMRVNEAPYVVEEVRRLLEKDYPKERILKGGLRVYTTVDLSFQREAEEALKTGLLQENRLFSERSPDEKSKIEGALAAVQPSDGAILALVGGSGFNFGNQLDRAVDIHRPVGSSIKPFVYASALESGKFKPDDTVLDAPVKYKVRRGRSWEPRNYGDKYHGEVTLRTALQKSLNSVAIRLLDEINLGRVVELFSRASGIPARTVPRDLSLALGTAEASPLQMAGAFSIFANGGIAVTPYLIKKIEDRDGRILREAFVSTASAQGILASELCRTMTEMMQAVFQEGGTAFHAAERTGFRIPAAGKTGTTNNYKDAWFTGFTPELSASVWFGHDDMRVAIGQDRTGGSVAAVAWMNFVKGVYRDRPTRDF